MFDTVTVLIFPIVCRVIKQNDSCWALDPLDLSSILFPCRSFYILETLFSRILLNLPQPLQLNSYFPTGNFVNKESSTQASLDKQFLCVFVCVSVCEREIATMPQFLGRNPLRDIALSGRSAVPVSLITHLCWLATTVMWQDDATCYASSKQHVCVAQVLGCMKDWWSPWGLATASPANYHTAACNYLSGQMGAAGRSGLRREKVTSLVRWQ